MNFNNYPTNLLLVVWIRTKEGRTILLSTEGLGVHISEVSHWRNLFKSAINPTGKVLLLIK